MRRALTVLIAGLIVAVVLLPFVTWGLALVGGRDAVALTFLLTTWPTIMRADSSRTPQLAAREDRTEGSARALLVGASLLGRATCCTWQGGRAARRGCCWLAAPC